MDGRPAFLLLLLALVLFTGSSDAVPSVQDLFQYACFLQNNETFAAEVLQRVKERHAVQTTADRRGFRFEVSAVN